MLLLQGCSSDSGSNENVNNDLLVKKIVINDVLNNFINKAIKITNLYGVLTKDDIDIVIIFYKLFSDYGSIYKSQNIKLEDIKELIENTCQQLDKCATKSLYKSYSQIVCNKRLVRNYTKKIQFFYKYFINKNTENILVSIKRKKKLLNEIWQIVKHSNKKPVYGEMYADSKCWKIGK